MLSIRTAYLTITIIWGLLFSVSCTKQVKNKTSSASNIRKEVPPTTSIKQEKSLQPRKVVKTAELALVDKPDTAREPIQRPRKYIPASKKLKEIPFVENAPLPQSTPADKKRGYMLFSRPITQPVYRNTHPLPQEAIKRLATFATKGEYEPLTFTIYPLRNMKNFRVIVSDLKSNDRVIAKDNLDLRLVTYWNLHYPMYTSKDTFRELPELLEKVTVNSFQKNECQRYWLTVKVPKNAKPGIYTGNITMFDDVSQKALQLPISLRVLDYQLKKDPKKHFTIFHLPYHHMYKAYKGKLIDKAITTDLKNMQNYGCDIFPDFYLQARKSKDGTDEFYLKPADQLVLNKAIELGFKGPIIIYGATNHFLNRYNPECKPTGGHGQLNKYPPDNSKYYPAITKAVKKYIAECKKKKYPEILFFPSDEPRAHCAEFTAKTYAAFKKGGAKNLITNDPTSSYAHFYRKHGGVDIWCSQAFAVPYDKVIKDKRYTYWSYPNHNSGELKDRVTMQKGGRMTYGYGLWRSGYSTLMPWAWRWFPGSKHTDQFDYFERKGVSGTGNRLDENGNFIPAVYWECFREGYDDGRYLYTLQQTIAERESSTDPKCQVLVKQGKKLLNEIWQKIPPDKKYLKAEFIDDSTFKSLRWQIADLTLKLLKYKEEKGVVAPSVMADTTLKTIKKDDGYYIRKGMKENAIEYFDLAKNHFSGWKPTRDKELTFSVKPNTEKKAEMNLKIAVDHKHKGIGWPFAQYLLKPENIDIKNYEFLYCKIKFDSDRDDVANDITKIGFVFKNDKGEKWARPDLGGNEKVWQTVQIPLTAPIFKKATKLLILPFEGFYPDKTKINFTISEIGLVKFKYPFIKQIKSVDTLLTSDKHLQVSISGYALKKGAADGYQCEVKLINPNGKVSSKVKKPLSENFQAAIPLKNLTPGKYKLELGLYNKSGKTVSGKVKDIKVIPGYL